MLRFREELFAICMITQYSEVNVNGSFALCVETAQASSAPKSGGNKSHHTARSIFRRFLGHCDPGLFDVPQGLPIIGAAFRDRPARSPIQIPSLYGPPRSSTNRQKTLAGLHNCMAGTGLGSTSSYSGRCLILILN